MLRILKQRTNTCCPPLNKWKNVPTSKEGKTPRCPTPKKAHYVLYTPKRGKAVLPTPKKKKKINMMTIPKEGSKHVTRHQRRQKKKKKTFYPSPKKGQNVADPQRRKNKCTLPLKEGENQLSDSNRLLCISISALLPTILKSITAQTCFTPQ